MSLPLTIGKNTYMSDTLTKHVFFSKILPILPVESSLRTYQEVEQQDFFLYCRSVGINIAISRDLNPIMENAMDLIDELLANEASIISQDVGDDTIQSILIVVRLISDIMEYYWIQQEKQSTNEFNPSYQKQRKTMKTATPGFATHRPSFHTMTPGPLDPAIATRVVNLSLRIKFHTRTFNVLKGMATPSTNTTTTNNNNNNGNMGYSFVNNSVMPSYRNYLEEKNWPTYAEKVDLAIDYTLKYIAASNPNEIVKFIQVKVITPLIINHIANESNVIQYLDIFGTFYLTHKNIGNFLDIVKKVSLNMKKSIFHSLFLYYASKSFLFWTMARPKEYIQLYQNLLHRNNENTDPSIKEIPTTVNVLFDNIYSHFNVSQLLTTTVETNNDQQQQQQQQHNDQHTTSTNKNNGSNNSTSSHPTSKPVFELSTPVSARSIPTPYSISSSDDHSDPSIASTAFGDDSSQLQSSQRQTAMRGQYPFQLNTDSNVNDTAIVDFDVGYRASSHSLENVLELYTNFHNLELLSYNSILRFLSMLLFLDVEVFNEINNIKFKNLLDAHASSNDNADDNSSTNSRHHSSNSSVHMNRSGSMSPTSTEDRSQGMRHFTQNLKRLTSLSSAPKKSKQIKFLTVILKNINGAQVSCDSSLIDSTRTLLAIMTMASSISMYNPHLPCVQFAKRFYKFMGANLDVGKNWNVTQNPFLIHCFDRNPRIKRKLQLEFFAASLQLEPDTFLPHLNLEKELSVLNLKRLSMYIEGFRIFFHLLEKQPITKEVARKTSEFFKTLFYNIADLLLKEFPYFDETVTDIVVSILDGSVLDKFEKTRTLSNINMPTQNKGTAESILSDAASTISSSTKSTQNKGPATSWDLESILPSMSGLHSNSDLSLDEIGETDNEDDLADTDNPSSDLPSLVSPSAQHALTANLQNKRFAPLSSPLGSERSKTSPAPLPPHTPTSAHIVPTLSSPKPHNSNGAKSLLSPKQNFQSTYQSTRASSRRSSDERLSKFISTGRASLKQQQLADGSNTFVFAQNSPVLFDQVNASDNDYARTLMMILFSIFKRLTNYFILPSKDIDTAVWASKDFRNIIKPIFVGVMDKNTILQNSAQSFMDVLINYIDETCEDADEEKLNEFYILSSYTVTLFSAALFDMKIDNSKRLILLQIVVKYLKIRSQLNKVATDSGKLTGIIEIETSVFPIMAMTLGAGIFISLFCNMGEFPSLLKRAYSDYYDALKFYKKYVGDIDSTYLYNIDFIKVMAVDNYTASGSVAFQRRLKNNILKYIKLPDSILLDAMNVLYKKWTSYTKLQFLNQQQLNDFRNIAGILAAISGVFLTTSSEVLVGFKNFPHLNAMQKDIARKINYFVKLQCSWLNNSELLTRENSRDLLSIELHPLSYGILLTNLKTKIRELYLVDLSLPDQESSYILLEQIIIILRTILRRDDDSQIIIWFSPNLIESISDVIDIVQKIDHKSIRYYKAIIQMSKMFKGLEHSEEYLHIKNHFRLKNKWIKLVISWFEETLNKDYDFENISKSHREMDLKKRDLDILYIDTSIESSRALAYLTKDVPLEVPFSNTKEELKRATSVMFGNYFTILLKGLETSTNLEKYPVALKHKISLLNGNLITSLTNLSIANVDASFQFTLPMGYSTDKNIKIAFLKVFIDIANNYPFQKTKSKKSQNEAVTSFINVLLKYPEFVYLGSLVCSSSEIDAYAAGIINAFETMNAGHIAVLELITSEIHNATRYLDVLRRNSCATRALSLYARARGNNYLVRTLRPTLQELIDKKDYFDIDKYETQEELDRSVNLFLTYLNKLTDAIVSSIAYFPSELRLVFQTIYREMKNKFPDYAYLSIGSFVFLRFLGPALVSPDSENIVISFEYEFKRSFILLTKVIQNMANGSDDFTKWPALQPHTEVLKSCSNKIFGFIKDLCNTDEVFTVPTSDSPPPNVFDYHFFHKFVYEHELSIRAETVKSVHSSPQFEALKDIASVVDDVLGKLGLPVMELSHDLPPFVKENMDKYPQLYEFMKRHAFKAISTNENERFPPIREAMSATGLPILIISCKELGLNVDSLDVSIYKTLCAYAKIWSNKHYVVLDCTGFGTGEYEFKKICTILFSLLPDIVFQTCIKFYYINVTDVFMKMWIQLRIKENPFKAAGVPYEFLNTTVDQSTIKGLGLTADSLQSLQNTRISLHDIELYNEQLHKFCPVTLKIGYKNFQILHEVPRKYQPNSPSKPTEVLLNDVFNLVDISTISVSNITGRKDEFTVNFFDGSRLIFSNAKYLEIIKMFYYAESKVDSEYSALTTEVLEKENKYNTNRDEIVAHLCLVILVGLFSEDETIKNISYNLLVSTQNAFCLDFGTEFYHSSEVYVPRDTTTFLSIITQSLSVTSPGLTPYIWKYMVDGLENGVIDHKSIPTVVTCLSFWIANFYDAFFTYGDSDGPDVASHVIQSLIRLTIEESDFAAVYLQQIWYKFALDIRLTTLVVDEIINHALERDSENREWKQVITLLTCFPTVEVASQIIGRFLDVIRTLLPSLTLESYKHSWSELDILANISISLFFESPLLSQMYLPELLYIIALLIDTGPSALRLTLHKLLMNICHSLTINESLEDDDREQLLDISTAFSRQKLNLIAGFSQDKGKLAPIFNTTSFTSKVSSLETFTSNIILVMEFSSKAEASFWKTKFKKYILDAIFSYRSFLSARAMMILGIMGKSRCSELLCRDILSESMQVFALPVMNEDTIFLAIAHTFSLSRLVEGLDPTLPIVKEMFWLATTLIDSPHPVLFEGALIFITNCLRQLYSVHFDVYHKKNLPAVLIEGREFASDLLNELDESVGVKWTVTNFPHIIASYIIRGLSIPVIKGTSPFCLKLLFENSYKEYLLNMNDNHYVVYLYLLYLLSTPEEFHDILHDNDINHKYVKLDSHNKIPEILAEWISSDGECSNISLYQSARLFSSPISDEPCKYRFSLIVRYLLEKNPTCVFRFYTVMRKELRRISSLEEGSDSVLISFDIINLLITHPEFEQLIEYSQDSEAGLEKRGLKMIPKFEVFDINDMSAEKAYGHDTDRLYRRRRLVTMVTGKMTNDDFL
ncbi:inhibitory regulator protein Ira1p [Monosporozyma unispora]|nr:hypothetical protein C6P44_000690 [Kazachstania unispora]